MPLTPLQKEITALLARNRTPDSHLAGGSALHFEPNTERIRDLDRLELVRSVLPADVKEAWLRALDEAETFVGSRPPSEIGCLYWSKTEGKFVAPAPGDDVLPHHGRPGGVLPEAVDEG